MDRQHDRNRSDQPDRREVLRRVEGQVAVQRLVDRERPRRREQQRVAVGRRAGDRIGADMPPAPAWFSTMTDLPHNSLSFCATSRAITSFEPPGGNGTTMRTGRSGKACAAVANPNGATNRQTSNATAS